MKLYIVPHSHIDVEWYWTQEDMEQMLPQLFYDAAVPMLEQDPQLRFAQDQTVIWEKLLNNASEAQRALILRKVQEGAFEPVGGTYVQPEVQEPCGESFVRQLQIGQRWLEKNLGRRARCAWHTDVFGQVRQLPQLFMLAGMDSFAFMRDINEKDDPETFPTEFFLEGPDGSRILTHWFRISYVLCESEDPGHRLVVANITTPETEEQELEYVFRQLLDETSLQHQTGLALLPWGNDVYALTLRSGEIREKLASAAKAVGLDLKEEDILISTPSAFFDALREKAALLPVKRCDPAPPKYRQDLRGTYLTRVKLKQQNRRAEQALLSYESLCACAGKQANTEESWKQVLFGQFHDTLGGSCIDETYLAAMERNEAVIRAVTAQKEALLGASEGSVLNVFNPTGLARSETVRVFAAAPCAVKTADGQALPWWYEEETKTLTVLVPQLGPYETVSLFAEPSIASAPTAVQTAENAYYRLSFDPVSGDLTGIFDREENRELLQGQGNVTVAMEETDPDMEGGLRLTGAEFTDEAVAAETFAVTETPLAVTVKTTKKFLGFTLKKTVTLPKDRKEVAFTLEIPDYPGADRILAVRFPFAMEQPGSLCETPYFVQPDRDGLFCAQKWAGLQDGGFTAAILNRGTCAYWAQGSTLCHGLLRSHRDFKEYAKYGTDRGLARFADGKSHTALAAEKGSHHFEYSLISGSFTAAEVSSRALRFNAPLEAVWSKEKALVSSPVCKVAGDLILTSLSPTEDGLCLRGYHACEEARVCTVRMAKPVSAAVKVNLLEEPMAPVELQGDTVVLPLRPHEIVTVHIT